MKNGCFNERVKIAFWGCALALIAYHITGVLWNVYQEYEEFSLLNLLSIDVRQLVLIFVPLFLILTDYGWLFFVFMALLILLQYHFVKKRYAVLIVAFDLYIWLLAGFWIGSSA